MLDSQVGKVNRGKTKGKDKAVAPDSPNEDGEDEVDEIDDESNLKRGVCSICTPFAIVLNHGYRSGAH